MTDLEVYFDVSRLDLADYPSELILNGLLNDGAGFSGMDSIRIIGPGDVNADGFIDGSDLSIIISHWGQSGLGWELGDLNGNGIVDGSDYSQVLSYWNPAPPEPAGVPEPTTIGLLLLGGLALLKRRR